MKKSTFIIFVSVLVSQGALAHTGTHPEGVLAGMAHLWTHVDHWAPAIAFLTALAAITFVAVRAAKPGAAPAEQQRR